MLLTSIRTPSGANKYRACLKILKQIYLKNDRPGDDGTLRSM